MRRSRWSRTLIVLLLVASMVALVGAGSALAQPPERVKVLIGFTQQPGPAEQALVHRAGGTIKYTYHLVPAIAATVPEKAIEGLRRNPNVTNIDLDLEVYAVDAELDNTWGVKRIDAGTVHAYNKGTGIKVAIIDSGIDYTHDDLDANYKGGYDFVNGDTDPMDDYGHGTHVAGTVAAEDNGIGVVGVAPEAALYALKVLDKDGGGYYSDIIVALRWAADNAMQVTNNSYGSAGYPGETVKAAFDNSAAAGILHVCAAGNGGRRSGRGDNVIYPARYESCIAVAATDASDKRASFSSTGPDVELSAPGVNIYSTYTDGRYATGSGTSMASPHVAGTAALVLAANSGWSNDQVRTQLQTTAYDLGDPGPDTKYGYGLVDADEAAPASATTGSIAGTVSNADGDEAISGTSVTVDTGQLATTDSNGYYIMIDVPTGDRSVTASADGFESQTKTASVTEGGTATLYFTLNPTPTPTPTPQATPTPTPEAGGTMHVASIDMSYQKVGRNYKIYTEVTIVDAADAGVEGATVSLEMALPSGTTASGSGDTGADGTVTFVYGPTKTTGPYESTVTNVVKAGWTYDETANVETSESLTVP